MQLVRKVVAFFLLLSVMTMSQGFACDILVQFNVTISNHLNKFIRHNWHRLPIQPLEPMFDP